MTDVIHGRHCYYNEYDAIIAIIKSLIRKWATWFSPELILRTDGGEYPPPEVFRRYRKNRGATRGMTISSSLFTHYMQVVTFYLEKSGHQISSNGPTSHHLFSTLRPRQSQSRWPSALKVAGCIEPIGTYNLYISDFLYRWLKVRSISWPSHYRSIRGK